MNVALIPARGGSKRIPRKNVRDFCGRPIIAWPIEAAQASGLFDRVVVSTDDAEIARVAEQCGAEALFPRPAHLSDDYTATTDVVAHAVRAMADQGTGVTAVCALYATAALVDHLDLVRGRQALDEGGWAYAFAATTFPAPIFRAFRQLPGGGVEMLYPEHFETRSQDLPAVLHDAGQFYWARPETWLSKPPIFGPHSCPIVIPAWRVQDIDDMDDWRRAELIFNLVRNRGHA